MKHFINIRSIMNKTNRYWVVIPAGGRGERFAASLPKQYVKVKHKTILDHTLSLFLSHNWITQIVVANAEMNFIAADYPFKVAWVQSGATRMHSVLNAMHFLKNKADENDWILIHDAVRPCLHPTDLMNLVESLQDDKVGGILATPVSETLKFVSQSKITHTVDRAQLWQAQTPQMFRYHILNEALNYCIKSNIVTTDEAMALEELGFNPKVIKAQYPNPKLTYQGDLNTLAALLCQDESLEAV
ncbi:MAG: 2-C-methyl-D-erythritol 4-phosphate cytidylyltransferase [Candidatus Berkiellales bacterium]